MPKSKLKQACNDCPFRRNAVPGWLGSGDVDHFVAGALADFAEYDLPCHLTIDYEDKKWLARQYPDASLCVGAQMFYRNVDALKLPRDPRRSAALKGIEPDHEKIFSTEEEFRTHHETIRTARESDQGKS